MSARFLLLAFLLAGPAAAENLYNGQNWSALAADRKAGHVGDIITILVFENDTASNSVTKGSKRRTTADGNIIAGSSFNKSAGVNFGGSYNGEGTNGRSDRIIAELSATVAQVFPNGDLFVSGWQRLKINGELTNIKVSGRIRRDDISSSNAITSSRIADAAIEYDGKGFATRSAKPGIVSQIFNWLGVI